MAEWSTLDALGMTHQPEEQNPVPSALMNALTNINNFRTGGLQRAFGLPNSSLGEILQNPDNSIAMGMATPLKGGTPVGTGMAGLRARLEAKYAANRAQREEMDKWLDQIGAKKSEGLPPISPDYEWTLSGRLVRKAESPTRAGIDTDLQDAVRNRARGLKEIEDNKNIMPPEHYDALKKEVELTFQHERGSIDTDEFNRMMKELYK